VTQIIINHLKNYNCLVSSKTEIYKQNYFMWDRHPYFTNLYYFWLGTLAKKG